MSDDKAFLDAILANPNDDETRLVYADWLEERGDPRAEFLRAETAAARMPEKDRRRAPLEQRMRELRPSLDAEWLALIDRTRIEGCSRLVFKFTCPKEWEGLKPTGDRFTRHCDECRKKVYYCDSVDLARRHAELGHCVAVDSTLVRTPGDVPTNPFNDPELSVMGRIRFGEVMPPPVPPREGQRVRVTSGPYAGIEGTVEALRPSRFRVTVRLGPTERATSVELDVNDVVPVPPARRTRRLRG